MPSPSASASSSPENFRLRRRRVLFRLGLPLAPALPCPWRCGLGGRQACAATTLAAGLTTTFAAGLAATAGLPGAAPGQRTGTGFFFCPGGGGLGGGGLLRGHARRILECWVPGIHARTCTSAAREGAPAGPVALGQARVTVPRCNLAGGGLRGTLVCRVAGTGGAAVTFLPLTHYYRRYGAERQSRAAPWLDTAGLSARPVPRVAVSARRRRRSRSAASYGRQPGRSAIWLARRRTGNPRPQFRQLSGSASACAVTHRRSTSATCSSAP